MTSIRGLSNYQWYFGPAGGGGLTFGASTNVDVMVVDGHQDVNVETTSRPMIGRHGDVPGVHLARGSTISLTIQVRKGTLTDAQYSDLIESVEDAFKPSSYVEYELHWKDDPQQGEKFCFARCITRKRLLTPQQQFTFGIMEMDVLLERSDPRWYLAQPVSDINNTGTVSVTPVYGSGRVYPLIAFQRNASDTRCRITNNTTGQVLDINGLPAATSDIYAHMMRYIRGEAGLVIYDGTTNRYGYWVQPREPFYFISHPAGATNSITINNGGPVDFTYYHTFL